MDKLKYNEAGKLYIRKSMLESFKFCPTQFKKTYLDSRGDFTNYILQVGTRFHEFAYWFFDHYDGFDVEEWTEFVPTAFTPREQEMAYWWITQEQKRYNHDPELFMPLKREMHIMDDTLCLMGTFDRIDYVDDKDTLAIVEYKTSKSFDREGIERQLSFYKLIWDSSINNGNIKYMRYINPRIEMYELIPINTHMTDKCLMDVASLRKAIRDNTFAKKCSPAKHMVCSLCDIDECGVYAERS
jgi:hypothetical protein